MIDVHAHLFEPQLADQIDEVIARFVKAGGTYIVTSPTDLESCQISLEQAADHSQILTTVGIHPEVAIPGSDIYISSVSEKWIAKNLEELAEVLGKHNEIIAIGECGLDYYWVKNQRIADREKIFRLQKQLLTGQIELAIDRNLPMVIHCRDEREDKQCEAEILELLVKIGNSKVKGIFHSYTGSLSYLEDILNLGFYISFNGIVTFKNADNVRELLDTVPDDRLFIESDAPLLVPNRERSMGIKVGEPTYIASVGDFIAKRRKMRPERLWEIIDVNFKKLFDISS